MITRHLYREADFMGGLRCMDCDRVMEDGDEIADDLTGMVGDIPMNEVICGLCATKRETASDTTPSDES